MGHISQWTHELNDLDDLFDSLTNQTFKFKLFKICLVQKMQ